VRGLCAFRVDKSIEEALDDLRSIGLKMGAYLTPDSDSRHRFIEKILDDAQQTLNVGSYLYTSRTCYFRRRKLYCRLYYDSFNVNALKIALFVSFDKGVLRALSQLLEALGWSRILYFEIVKYSHPQHPGKTFL